MYWLLGGSIVLGIGFILINAFMNERDRLTSTIKALEDRWKGLETRLRIDNAYGSRDFYAQRNNEVIKEIKQKITLLTDHLKLTYQEECKENIPKFVKKKRGSK